MTDSKTNRERNPKGSICDTKHKESDELFIEDKANKIYLNKFSDESIKGFSLGQIRKRK